MKIKTIVASLILATFGVNAQATTIDFRSMQAGTAVTNGFKDFTASLSGGNASGAPLIDQFGGGLSNSPNEYYPTAQFLNIKFTSAVDQLSFNFQNHGFNGANQWATYDANNVLLESGWLKSLDLITATKFGSGGISMVSFNNGFATGQHNWIQSLSVLNYNLAPIQAVPEPVSILLLGVGLAGLAAARRRKSV